jgi:hypothetical protein
MKTNYSLIYFALPALVVLFGAHPVRAESDINGLSNVLKSSGASGLTSLIEAGGLGVPRIPSGDNSESAQTELLFGRSLLRYINLIAAKEGGNTLETIANLLVIGEWIKGDAAYGNLVIGHRALDVAGALTLKTIGAEATASEEVIALAKRVAETTIEPSYRAQVLDKELNTQIFSKQIASMGMNHREQVIRKLWKNFCFLGYFETNPANIPDLDKAKQSILQSLGDQADAFVYLGRTVSQRVLAPQTLQFTSTELLEARNLWFVSMASAPGNIGDIASVVEYLNTAKKLPKTEVGDSREAIEKAFTNHWNSFDAGGNPTIARRVASIAYRARSGAPLDRDSSITEHKIP